MAYTLTFSGVTVTVNGSGVTSPYTLQNNDVISAKYTGSSSLITIYLNGTALSGTQTKSLSNMDISISTGVLSSGTACKELAINYTITPTISFCHLFRNSPVGTGTIRFRPYTVAEPLPQLATVSNVSVEGTTVSWDEVENATSYEVKADGVSIGTVENESSTDATVTITNTSTEYNANVGTSNNGMANSDIGIVSKNSSATFIITKGTIIYISANTGNGSDIWVTTSITGEIVGEINAGGTIGELTINGNGTITGYAYNND